ncbi:MAG TPA: hypothetical protein VFN65_10845 [Solirubrobacteraceae bacterium]|nr:hypothetical protein [Solirubrobacteraceae bacterium]
MSAAREAEALEVAWQDAGWGPRRASPLAEHDPPLLFSLRWPAPWQVDEFRVDRTGAPWVIVTQRARLTLPRDGAPDMVLLAALSVSLADAGAPPPVSEMGDHARPVAGAHHVGVRTSAVRTAAIGAAGPRLEVRVVRFMLSTPYGVLALAFTAPQPQFYDVMEPMFDHIAQTARLDPCAS